MGSALGAASEVDHYAVVGMGVTGISCARYLRAKGSKVSLVDSRSSPPAASAVLSEFDDCDVCVGDIPVSILSSADYMIVSPGISLRHPSVQQAIESGAVLVSDLDIFRDSVAGKVVCITGSNGKSTVATLLSLIAEAEGIKVCLCGNIGTPVLDVVDGGYDLYVVEVSSFQLERSGSLRPDVSVVLNISPDHMDRYSSFQAYREAKARVHKDSAHCVLNRDEQGFPVGAAPSSYFGFGDSSDGGYGIDRGSNGEYLACDGEHIINVTELALRGRHNYLNALAAIAMVDCLGISRSTASTVMKRFPGLPHRCETVLELDQITYINDSKGTNPGATLAALNGLGDSAERKLVLIAGGVAKDADFSVLRQAVQQYVSQLIVFGRDAAQVREALTGTAPIEAAENLDEAVSLARAAATHGDFVLFSPACASFDMYDNFEQRGDAFRASVMELSKAGGGQ